VSLGYVRLGWKYSRKDMFRFRFYSSNCIHRRRARTYQHTAFAVLYMVYFRAYTKATPASVQGVGVDFSIHVDFAYPQRCESCS